MVNNQTRQAIIERTISAINHLPEDKAVEVADFADFIVRRFEENHLSMGMQELVGQSHSFNFLNHEEDIYTEADIKQPYNG